LLYVISEPAAADQNSGWLTVTGWQAVCASGCYLCADLIEGLIVLRNPHYVGQPWQIMLLCWAAMTVSVLVNTVISKLLPRVESLMLILHVFGFFGILIPLTYFAPHGTAEVVFTEFMNEGGWPTQGLSFMVGCVAPAFVLLGQYLRLLVQLLADIFAGADCATHVCAVPEVEKTC
jgi:choline transport protein